MKNKIVMVFDTETNGFGGASVLSFSAYKVLFSYGNKPKIISKINRFYYPEEIYNPRAIAVNGLSESEINYRRSLDVEIYPKLYKDDLGIYDFCSDVDIFVAHNIIFDIKSVPMVVPNDSLFCTMKSNREICRIPYANSFIKKGEKPRYKDPKLSEAAEFYGIVLDNDKLHESIYDVELAWKVFMSMYIRNNKEVISIIGFPYTISDGGTV